MGLFGRKQKTEVLEPEYDGIQLGLRSSTQLDTADEIGDYLKSLGYRVGTTTVTKCGGNNVGVYIHGTNDLEDARSIRDLLKDRGYGGINIVAVGGYLYGFLCDLEDKGISWGDEYTI